MKGNDKKGKDKTAAAPPGLAPPMIDPSRGLYGRPPKSVGEMLADKIHHTEESPSIFHPVVLSTFGPLLFGCKGTFEAVGDNSVPMDAAAYLITLKKLDKADPLGCDAYYDLRPKFSFEEKTTLAAVTQRRHLAYDHVELLTGHKPTMMYETPVLSVYIARGRPDKWRPDTKKDHRRVMRPGTWVADRPVDDSNEAFWAARRNVALMESLEPDEPAPSSDDSQVASQQEYGLARAYFYAHPDDGPEAKEGSTAVALSSLQLLNQHLGKAGGLNFGLEAILHTEHVAHPGKNRPWIFGIIDARHSCDSRFWLSVLPAFHVIQGSDEQCFLSSDICLCQIPHSYVGMVHATDKLDIRNDFLFTGMAVVRDRCYGMTSCGTGGIWSITSPRNIGSYFYGRTMIEDTSTSHMKFLGGERSVYLAPQRGTDNQLMRATPKVSANYLEALERWDTGAVQIFMAQGLLSRWFWFCYSIMIIIILAMLAPAFTHGEIMTNTWSHVDKNMWQKYLPWDITLLVFSTSVICTIFIAAFVMSLSSPGKLNYCLRYLILLFNTVYPTNSIASVFWLSLPPWLLFTAQFPFSLNAVAATVGSLGLKWVEFSIIKKMKKDSEQHGSELSEMSIFRSQQMDKVTVPIKIRAVMKGLSTGWQDVKHKHDNSWWESFGAAQAAQWVQMWLLAVSFSMLSGIIAGITHLIIGAFSSEVVCYILLTTLATHFITLRRGFLI